MFRAVSAYLKLDLKISQQLNLCNNNIVIAINSITSNQYKLIISELCF